MKLKRKAFTLVELIVVIAILAILAVTSFTVLTKWFNKARDSKRMTAVADIKGSIERYISQPEHANLWSEVYTNSGTLSNVTNDTNWNHSVLTVDVDQKFLDALRGLDLQKAPKDPLGKDYYRFGVAYTNNPNNAFDVAATLEYNGDNPEYNAYVQGTYISGSFDGRAGLVADYQFDNTTGDYVYLGSTDKLPYSLED